MILGRIFAAIVPVSDQRLEPDRARAWGGKDNYFIPLIPFVEGITDYIFDDQCFIRHKIVLLGKK